MKFDLKSTKFKLALRYIICIVLMHISISPVAAQPSTNTAPSTLTVVMDDNYPPYIQLNPDGTLDGYLVDIWKLWQAKTGVKVNLVAVDWFKVQQLMAEGKADVIDTIFKTQERQKNWIFPQLTRRYPPPSTLISVLTEYMT